MITHLILVGCLLICNVSSQDQFSPPSGMTPLDMLMKAVPGTPGEDYPIFAQVPETGFTCEGKVEGGYYVDVEADCQPFHVCTRGGHHPRGGRLVPYSFLCPNGSLFNQQYFICDWWFNVDCSESESLYYLNDQLFQEGSNEIQGSARAAQPQGGGSQSEPIKAFQESSRSRGNNDFEGSFERDQEPPKSFPPKSNNNFQKDRSGNNNAISSRPSSQFQSGSNRVDSRGNPNLNRVSVKELRANQQGQQRGFNNQINSAPPSRGKETFSSNKKQAKSFQKKNKGSFRNKNDNKVVSNGFSSKTNKGGFNQGTKINRQSPSSSRRPQQSFSSQNFRQNNQFVASTQGPPPPPTRAFPSKTTQVREQSFKKAPVNNKNPNNFANGGSRFKAISSQKSSAQRSFGSSFKTPGATVQIPGQGFNEFSREREDFSEIEFLRPEDYPSFTTLYPSGGNFKSSTGRFAFANKDKAKLSSSGFIRNTLSPTSQITKKPPTIIQLNVPQKITFVQIKKINSPKVTSFKKTEARAPTSPKINEIASFSRGNTKNSLQSMSFGAGFGSAKKSFKNENKGSSSFSAEKHHSSNDGRQTHGSKTAVFGTGIRTFSSGQKPKFSKKTGHPTDASPQTHSSLKISSSHSSSGSSSSSSSGRSLSEKQRLRQELIPTPPKKTPLISKFADPTFVPLFGEEFRDKSLPLREEAIEVPSLTYGVPLAEPIQIPSVTYGVPLAEPLTNIEVPSETYGLPASEPLGINSQVLVNEPPPPPPPIL